MAVTLVTARESATIVNQTIYTSLLAINQAKQADKNVLHKCESWAMKRWPSGPGSQPLIDCPLNVKSSGQAYASVDETTKEYRMQKDAINMCSRVATAQAMGILPQDPEAMKSLALIDVGAMSGGEFVAGNGLGFYTVSFEARKSEYDQLQSHFGHFTGGRIIHAAVSSTYAKSNVTIWNAGGSSSLEHMAIKNRAAAGLAKYEKKKTDVVPSMSLDFVFQHVLDRIAFIKIDVQGHEFEVLGGALSILNRSRPVLWFEYDPVFRGWHSPWVLCLVKFLGYYSCFKDTGMVLCLPNREQQFEIVPKQLDWEKLLVT